MLLAHFRDQRAAETVKQSEAVAEFLSLEACTREEGIHSTRLAEILHNKLIALFKPTIPKDTLSKQA